MEPFSQVNECHPDTHSTQYQIEQSNTKEDVDGNQGNCSTQNENNVTGAMQTIQICSINKKINADQNCISENTLMAHWFNRNSSISRNIEMTDWFSQESQSSNLLLYTWPKPHPPPAINQSSKCSSDCIKLKQKLLDMRNKESALIDRCLNLERLFGKKCEELTQQKQEEFKQREIAEAKIQVLMSGNEFLQVERHKMSSRLQVADRSLSNMRRENNILRERLKSIAPQNSRNEENQSTQALQLQINQTELKAMTQRATELEKFCSHLLRQRDHLIKDFEFQHEKKVLNLKKEMHELQRSLNSKIQETEQLQNRLAKFQANSEEISNEKSPNSEIRKLVLQIQCLEEEKSQLEQWNSILNGELKFLEDKLRARKELSNCGLTLNFDRKHEAYQHSNEKHASLQSVPEGLSKELQVYESQSDELKRHLEHLSKEFPYSQETTKHYESCFIESKENADINKIKRDHEIELTGIKNQYESKILDLEKEIEILRVNLSQIEEEKNKLKVLNDALLDQREAWNKEQTEYQKTKLTLQEKIKATEELEVKLQEKVNKYESHLAVMERKHQEEISKLQLQIFELTKSESEKENKTGAMVPTGKSPKPRNILMKCLKQTEQIKVTEYNSENVERSSQNSDLDIVKQGFKIPGYNRR